MSTQTASHSPEFQALIAQVETALIQAAADARELAERTGTPLVVRDVRENQSGDHMGSGLNPHAIKRNTLD
jgi:hypothetical protein